MIPDGLAQSSRFFARKTFPTLEVNLLSVAAHEPERLNNESFSGF
jgi:hypothetical protein